MIDLNDIFKIFDKNTTNSLFFKNYIKEINTAYSLLSDNRSKSIFVRDLILYLLDDYDIPDALKYQIIGSITSEETVSYIKNTYPNSTNNPKLKFIDNNANYPSNLQLELAYCMEQYCYYNDLVFPVVNIHPTSNDICIDGGVMWGETSIWLASKFRVKHIYGFEPFKESFDLAINNFKYNGLSDKISIYNMALSENNKPLYLKLNKSQPGANFIINDIDKYVLKYGNTDIVKVSTIKLDDFCKNNSVKPSYIALDIEGSELDVLKGGKNIIEKCRPTLAISIYHKREHLFQIINYLHEINSSYKFYLKKIHKRYDTVLFAC